LLPVLLPAQLAFSGTAQPQLATEVLPTREDICTHSVLREANAGSCSAGMAPPPTPVWAYFDRTALPYGASPTHLVYALCKLYATLSAEDRKAIDDNISAAAKERKKLDHVAEVAGELGWDKFVELDENEGDEDEGVEHAERARSFQLYEMEKIPSGTADDFESGDLPRDRLFGFRGFKRPLQTLVNGVVLPSMTRIGRLEEE
jgi:hypothetical protein